MSKLVVYVLDKMVWLLLVTVIAGQALQLAGIIDTPKSAGAVEYQRNSIETLSGFPEGRWKRDTSDASASDRSKFIDMLFNIPIKTLTAVNNLVQNSRPAFRKLREFAVKRLERTTKAPDTETNVIRKRSPVYIRPVSGPE